MKYKKEIISSKDKIIRANGISIVKKRHREDIEFEMKWPEITIINNNVMRLLAILGVLPPLD